MHDPVPPDSGTSGQPSAPPPLLQQESPRSVPFISAHPPSMPPPGATAAAGNRGVSKGWRLFAVVLFVALGLSLLGNLVLSFRGISGAVSGGSHGHGRHSGDHFMEAVLEDNGAKEKILVIGLDGVIGSQAVDPDGSTIVDVIHDQLDRALHDDSVKAVILRVDSPGGEVLASDEIYRLLQNFQDHENGKPVIAQMGNLAASGGYYVSAPCRWIVANELTMTGSIGVIMHGYNYRGLMDKVGVRPQVFKSGKFKDMLSPDKTPEEETAEEKAMIQSMIMETFARFKSVVAEGRKKAAELNQKEGRPLVEDWESLADGRILSGKTAYEKGFVDELGNFDTAVSRAKQIAGIDEANLVSYQLPFSFGNFLRFFGQAESKGVRVDLGIEVPKMLLPGRLYYVAPTFVH